MPELLPQNLTDMSDVAAYWRRCLHELDEGHYTEQQVAGHMVGVVANKNDVAWGEGANSHPAYPIIFELAASLELPEHMTGQRPECWECIKALVSVLERKYPGRS